MRVLMLSSWVARGHVGLSAGAPALQLLAYAVTQLPTVILSNHPGFAHVSGLPVPVDQLHGMITALEGNGWLDGIDALQTGYLPTPEHVALAAGLAERLRRSGTRIVVDPVLGDAPKGLYLPASVADALRDDLAPLADTLTPNVFELGWLTGRAVDDPDALVRAARALADSRDVLVTSVPAGPGRIGVLRAATERFARWSAPRHDGVPHGVGDVFAALIAADLPVGAALGHLDALIRTSLHAPHLRIAECAADWTTAPPLQEDI